MSVWAPFSMILTTFIHIISLPVMEDNQKQEQIVDFNSFFFFKKKTLSWQSLYFNIIFWHEIIVLNITEKCLVKEQLPRLNGFLSRFKEKDNNKQRNVH